MALIVSEMTRISTVAQIMVVPDVEQEIAISGSSTASSAFGSTTRYVRLMASAACHVAFGAAPTATTAKFPLAANVPEYIEVKPGDKVAVIQAA